MEKYNTFAKDIIEHVGGKENIASLRHCITRLRFHLVDESKADDAYLKNLDGVITVIKATGEYMVVIGEHVHDVYEEIGVQIGMNQGVIQNEENKKKDSLFNKFLLIVMGCMGPTLNLMCACGIIKGLTVLFTLLGLSTTSGIYLLLSAAGDCFFFFMPMILGYNVAKTLNIDPVFGFILSAALCYPSVQGVNIEMFGYTVNATYTTTFLPAVFGVLFAAPIFKFFNRVIPASFRGFGAPLVTLLITFPLTFIVVGPLANLIGVGVNTVITYLYEFSPIVGGALLGGVWQVLVLFGVHGILSIFPFMELMQGHSNQLLAFVGAASFAQIAVVLAIYLKTKDKKLKAIALPAFISGFFGVTEPAIYGVTLPRIKMFIISCIGSAIGGFIVAITGITMYTYAGAGAIGLLGLLNPEGAQVVPIVLMVAIPMLVSFVLAFILYKDDDQVKDVGEKAKNEKKMIAKEIVLSPMKGIVKSLSESGDEAFASGALGKGVVIMPKEGKVVAPFDGIVRTLFPTHHAIGVVSQEGCEILIHIGIDTVRLEGEGFKAFVTQGDFVRAGQTLVEFDCESLMTKGYDLTSPIVVTNSDNYLDVLEMDIDDVNCGEQLLTVIC